MSDTRRARWCDNEGLDKQWHAFTEFAFLSDSLCGHALAVRPVFQSSPPYWDGRGTCQSCRRLAKKLEAADASQS
jgi:hypothetical protein